MVYGGINMKRGKKSKIFAAILISCTLLSASLVHAASSSDGYVTGSHYTELGYKAVKNTAWTASNDYSIPIYAKACFSNMESDDRQSSVTTGYAEVWASSAEISKYYAYGYHGYLYNGPRCFYSW
jgi:hypothetical protein